MPLITTNELPPGGWRYTQKRPDGSAFKYMVSMGGFTDFCKEVQALRISNGFPETDLPTVELQVNRAQCDRLGNDPRYCMSGSGPVMVHNQAAWVGTAGPDGGCGGCGGQKA